MIWVPLVVVAILALLAAIPWLRERRRTEIGSEQRNSAVGRFARLPQGVTHFQWHGASRGKVIVAVHLVAMGYRVLTYDLYGRGLSDAPTGPQDRHFFLRQLHDLLQHEGIENEVTLLGYSMGGTIVTAFAQEQPHRIAQVLLVAPSGIITNESTFSRWCRRLPMVGDWLQDVIGARRMRRQLQNAEHWPDVVKAQTEQLNRKGYLAAVLSSRRHMLREDTESAHRSFAGLGLPVAAVWGDMDQVVPVTALGKLASWNKETRQEVIKGADHSLPYTGPRSLRHKALNLLAPTVRQSRADLPTNARQC